MASAFAVAPVGHYPSPLHSNNSMSGFGPSSGPYLGITDGQRLQYYSSQQAHAPAPAPKDLGGRRVGKVKFFDTQKGYGFINDYRSEEIGNEEVFVHYTAITAKAGFKSLAEGEEAEYELVRGPKGFQAANVTGPGGSQVVGDTRSRANKNAFLAMSPYAAMFPYIHQDPTSFYANSPYAQQMMIMPQGPYREPNNHPANAYRHVPAPPSFPANPSPYASPAPIRPYDIGKDFAGVNLAGLSVDEGIRGSKALGGSTVPFGGMFGSLPGFDGSAAANVAPGPGMTNNFPSIASNGGSATNPSNSSPGYKGYPGNNSTVSGRSGSVDSGDKGATAGIARDAAAPSRGAEPLLPSSRPPTQHSRSTSLLYASKQAGSPSV